MKQGSGRILSLGQKPPISLTIDAVAVGHPLHLTRDDVWVDSDFAL